MERCPYNALMLGKLKQEPIDFLKSPLDILLALAMIGVCVGCHVTLRLIGVGWIENLLLSGWTCLLFGGFTYLFGEVRSNYIYNVLGILMVIVGVVIKSYGFSLL